MRCSFATLLFVLLFHGLSTFAQSGKGMVPGNAGKTLFLDVHELGAGKVTYDAVAGAHAKDLAVQDKYGVNFIKYWVDESRGLVYCLASAMDTASIMKTHAEAHGLLPTHVYPVTDGLEAALKGNKELFLDIHYLGAGKVTAKDVAAAHLKDLAVQGKYGVNLINYWVDEKEGIVMCLAEASNEDGLIKTHKEAHGLIPDKVMKVQQGQ
ncbi:MAG TPA: DUF4242 domain-containing protein [Chitinophagaceae bacterium]|nr:DUF4242 domain-containing protein [Chitinophagaceae bacterium]